jgi:hypothetical protein
MVSVESNKATGIGLDTYWLKMTAILKHKFEIIDTIGLADNEILM